MKNFDKLELVWYSNNPFFNISVDSYDENVNVRSFGFDAMWGNIGGYVGMILGVTLFQLPNIIYSGFHFLKSFISRKADYIKILLDLYPYY